MKKTVELLADDIRKIDGMLVVSGLASEELKAAFERARKQAGNYRYQDVVTVRQFETSVLSIPVSIDAFRVGQEAMRHYIEGLFGKLPIIFRWPKWLPFALLALSLVLLTLGIGA